jgi:Dyp-type peroxidase family
MPYEEPVLALDDIQGNILNGFNKHHQWMLGFRIDERDLKALAAAKRWIRALADEVTPVTVARHAKEQAKKQLRERETVDLDDLFLAISFSYDAIVLLVEPVPVLSQAFVDGQWRRASSVLGDDPARQILWKVGGSRDTTPHIFVVYAADKRHRLQAAVSRLIKSATRHDLHMIYSEEGSVIPTPDGKGGYEHFGFRDNIAKIRMRGRKSHRRGDYYTKRMRTPQDPLLPEFAAAGQPLFWPGQILLGYESQSATDARTPYREETVVPHWHRNGSYLVFRRLRQHVGEFRQFIAAQAASMFGPQVTALEQQQFAAMLVGRWYDGTPLALSPKRPAGLSSENDFLYQRPNWPRGSGSLGDALGEHCPVSAHIRKVNPRDQGSDLGPAAENLRRALIRRGIPYGKVLPPKAAPDSEEWNADRGLLFLCYQSSIEAAFETLVQDWMNSTAGPTTPPGFDIFVGQNPTGGQRFCTLAGKLVSTNQRFVEATGGGYFFTPSISAVRWIASKQTG